MIGHFLITLTPEEEDRVLTTEMRPGAYNKGQYLGPCLVGTSLGIDAHWSHRTLNWWERPGNCSVENRYDAACKRFGRVVVNRVIRNRILANQVRRALQRERELVAA
jgi:hypothetical protein